MAVLVKGTGAAATDWGIPADAASLVTQRISSAQKVDKKEAIKHDGEVQAVCYYNKNTEISIEGLGVGTTELAATIAAISGLDTAGGIIHCSEITIDFANEEFAKTSIKGRAWATIA